MRENPRKVLVPSLIPGDVNSYENTPSHISPIAQENKLRACLVVIGGELAGRVFEITSAEVLIGRAPEAPIRVREWGVSRLHAKIRCVGEELEVIDLESANGTFVNQYRIVGPTRLKDGDRIRVGRSVFKFSHLDDIEEKYHRFVFDAVEAATQSGRLRVPDDLQSSVEVLALGEDQLRVPCAIYRGGTSKALFFLESDLPRDPEKRDRIVLAAFGSPDIRQIDGLGGADPLTSKVGYIGPSSIPGADVDYTFGYVAIAHPVIDYAGSCGNTAAAVGPFALLRGLIDAKEPVTRVRIHNTNTGKIIVAEFVTRNGKFVSEGDVQIDGVPGRGSKIRLDFEGSGGSVTGLLLPTGKPREEIVFPGIGTLAISLVDAANPFIFARGEDLGLRGNEAVEEVSGNVELLKKCETIRCIAAEIMGIASRADATRRSPGVPKVALVSKRTTYLTTNGRREEDPIPRTVNISEIDIVARMTALQKLHKTFAVTGAVCLGAAAKIEGTIVNEIFLLAQPSDPPLIRIGHPSGTIEVEMCVTGTGSGLVLEKATIFRTARLIMDGNVYVGDI